VIEIKGINKTFGDRHIVKDISFTFEEGKTNLIIGESGCGKTTILKLMVGLHQIDSGEILYDGLDFPHLGHNEKQDVRTRIWHAFPGRCAVRFPYGRTKCKVSARYVYEDVAIGKTRPGE
jgi:phospholipid/cholesterol/gamma-HCH transport system ATP-binding protein